jgi:hypothetical protein
VTAEKGNLLGGPHDGVELDLNGFWLAVAPDALPLPAERVLVTWDGRVTFWWRTRAGMLWTEHGPSLSRYDVDGDHPGWVFRYVGEVDLPISPEDQEWRP